MPRSTLEEIAARCLPGEGAVELHPLQAGLINASYRAERGGRSYWLRIAAADSDELGLDRVWECRVLTVAATAGLAPRIRYSDPVAGVLVADWASGRPWTAAEVRQPGNIDAMAGLLRRVHALPVPQPARVMTPAAWVAQYEAALGWATGEGSRRVARIAARARGAASGLAANAEFEAELEAQLEERLRTLAALESAAGVLCHSDLHVFNVLVEPAGRPPVLLDWEFAHVTQAFWDLAGWVANNDLDEVAAGRFLASYLGRRARPEEWEGMRHWVFAYDYVCLLWSELYLMQRPDDRAGDVSVRVQRLLERLPAESGSRAG